MNKYLFSFGAALLLPFAMTSAAAAPPPAEDVVILSTGDRLTPGYQVTVHPNGAIASVLVPRGQHTPVRHTDKMIAANRQRFFSDLASAEPLPSLPTGALRTPAVRQGGRQRGGRTSSGGAASRVSLYPEIFVRYRGRQSPNLRQASTSPGRVLYQDVKQILQVLRMPIPNIP